MTASVHDTIIGGGKLQIGLFVNRQSVDIRPQRYRRNTFRTGDIGNNACAALNISIRDAEPIQLFSDLPTGSLLFPAQLRMPVQIPAESYQSVAQRR